MLQNKDRSAGPDLPLPLSMGTVTSFGICGSVSETYIMLYRAIMPDFFHHSGTSPISRLQLSDGAAACCVLKTQPLGADGQQSTEQDTFQNPRASGGILT